jgi:hypothetical protein
MVKYSPLTGSPRSKLPRSLFYFSLWAAENLPLSEKVSSVHTTHERRYLTYSVNVTVFQPTSVMLEYRGWVVSSPSRSSLSILYILFQVSADPSYQRTSSPGLLCFFALNRIFYSIIFFCDWNLTQAVPTDIECEDFRPNQLIWVADASNRFDGVDDLLRCVNPTLFPITNNLTLLGQHLVILWFQPLPITSTQIKEDHPEPNGELTFGG